MPFLEFENRKILFVHIPKTGGTSVEEWMKSIAPLRLFTIGIPKCAKTTAQHFTIDDISHIFGSDFFDYKFAIIRNPFARIESEYKMQHSMALAKMRDRKNVGFPVFQNWLESALNLAQTDPFAHDSHIRPQWEFIDPSVKIFRFEAGLKEIVAEICEDTGLPLPDHLPHLMGSSRFDGEIIWDENSLNRVRTFYMRDFQIFGYRDTHSGDLTDDVGDGQSA